jgi:VanZ family protein
MKVKIITKSQFNRFLEFVERYLPLILVCVFIFIQSGKQARVVSYDGNTNYLIHKIAHFFLFSLVFLFAHRSFGNKKQALVFTVLYGISDEIHQNFVPTRTPSIIDIMIDSGAGLTWYLLIEKYKRFIPEVLVRFFNL